MAKQKQRKPDRTARQGRKTLSVLRAGRYRGPSGAWVSIRSQLQSAEQNTVSYSPDADVPWPSSSERRGQIDVENIDALAAGHYLTQIGHEPVVLNFASAKRPGGGFLSGAQAQEESLARASGLYACIAGQPMYAFHREQDDPIYSSYALYSPHVPVFRDGTGCFLEKPYEVAIITCAAPNAGRLPASRRYELEPAMRERIERVLAIGAYHRHDAIVLGAWGCGVFQNSPAVVARLFREALRGAFRGVYTRVMFAVLDSSKDHETLRQFEKSLSYGHNSHRG